jgi:hypothetical protein
VRTSQAKTNDHRLITHIAKHFKIDPTDYQNIEDLFSALDAMWASPPLAFRDLLCVYETFPVFGEFMFPKGKSYLWQLIESTDSPMLLTDALISGKDGLFICQAVGSDNVATETERILSKLNIPSMCINHRHGTTALLYPLNSL